MKTVKFFATIGVVAGYQNQNITTNQEALDVVSNVWQQKASELYQQTGTYISGSVSPANAIYHVEWGCPVGGEKIVAMTGECNPNFTSIETYKEVVVKLLELMKEELKQSATQVAFQEVDLIYIN